MTFVTTPGRCFFNAPFAALGAGLLDTFLTHGLQPEIGLEGDVLYRCQRREFEEVADALKAHGIGCTLHAPFFDLAPGALDREVLRVTRDKLAAAFDLVPLFRPKVIVCHLGYEADKHGYKLEEWFAASLGTWRLLLPMAARHGAVMVLENTYETTPEQHLRLLEAIDSPQAGFCLDTGHLNSFAACSWGQWLPRMSPWLRHLHLHDNDGSADQHRAPGRGTFDFAGLFAFLAQNGLTPTVTFEPHTEDDMWRTIEAAARMGVVRLTPASKAKVRT